MVRLRDLDPRLLREIRRFVRQKRGKVPVTGGGPTPDGGYVKNMVELVRERFGVELSPAQIYRLQRGGRRRVSLDEDVAEWLEDRFGSVSEGLRRVERLLRQMAGEPPAKYRHAVAQLGGRTLDYEEAVHELRELGYENPDEVIRELFRLGFGRNAGGRLQFFRHRRPPELELLAFFGA